VLEFVLKFRLAHSFITDGKNRIGFLCLSICFQLLSTILPSKRIALLYIINAAFEVSSDFSLPEILVTFFQHLCRLTEIQLGSMHPATEITRRLAILEPAQHAIVLGIMRRLRADYLGSERVTGTAFNVYDRSVDMGSNTRQQLVSSLQLLLVELEVAQNSYIMTLWVRMRLAIAMLDERQFDQVERMIQIEYPSQLIQLREPKRMSLVLQCYKIRGYMWMKEGKLEKAASMFQMGIMFSDATWGRHSEIALGFADDAYKLRRLQSRSSDESVLGL
jgi:hypothetical protein